MANQYQLDILKQGVEVWNQWRKANNYSEDYILPDLSGAHLSGADLSDAHLNFADLNGADLSHARLSGANLRSADLSDANLSRAYLRGADLNGAHLNGANLNRAFLSHAHLNGADLNGADLNGADLGSADLGGADLGGADLSGAFLYYTVFVAVDLSTVKGLETVSYAGPSSIGIDTIYRSQGKIPEAFLKGAGVDDTFIAYIRSLVGKPIEYYSCFISYSSKDDAFARRLYADLQSNNVRCWYAPEDLKWGARTRPSIDEAIRLHDKLLLILSKSSVASGWVEREVKTALAKERKEKRTVLFPVRVDKAVYESPFAWATEIRHERNIGDFTHWKNHDDYEKAFTRLLRDLKSEAMTG